MTQLIKKEEAMSLLAKDRKHYLWLKPFKDWSKKDVDNLRNENNINHGQIKKQGNKQKVVEIVNGVRTEYESIAEASRITGIKISTIYAVVNGHRKISNIVNWEKIL